MMLRQRTTDGGIHDLDCGPRPLDVFGSDFTRGVGVGVGGELVMGERGNATLRTAPAPGTEEARARAAAASRRYRLRRALGSGESAAAAIARLERLPGDEYARLMGTPEGQALMERVREEHRRARREARR